VREKVVINVMTKVKPIILKKFSVKVQNSDKSKERPPSPSSVSSTNSSVSGDPSVAETKGLLSKHSSETSQPKKSETDKHAPTHTGNESESHIIKRTKIHEQEIKTTTIVIHDLQDKKTKDSFQSIERDLEKLTLNGNKNVNSNLKEETRKNTDLEATTNKKIKSQDEGSLNVSKKTSRRKIDPWDEIEKEENHDNGHQYLEMKKLERKVRIEKEDEILEDMCNVVDRLQTITVDINKEIGVQTKIIEEIHEEVDDASSAFVMLTKKMDNVINTEKNGFKIIVILSLIIVVLVILVFIIL